MAKDRRQGLHWLSPREVLTAKTDAPDGGGLLLRVKPDDHASWVLRYTGPTGRRREMGLGPCHRNGQAAAGESLTAARKAAADKRALLEDGVDPLDKREADRAAKLAAEASAKRASAIASAIEHWTLARCARDYHERVVEPKLSTKHSAQWIASLENHIPRALWHAPVATIEPPAVVDALLRIKPHKDARNLGSGDKLGETRSRILQRLSVVFEDARFHKRCATNPADRATRLKITEAAPKRQRGEFRALPYAEAPAALQRVLEADGVAAQALAFAVFCAARTGEVLGATWDEIDIDAKVWRIEADRMKAGRAHEVPLSPQALAVLDRVRGLHQVVVFPTTADVRGRLPHLSNMAMLMALERAGLRGATTAHGLARATFSTWANERRVARSEVVEAALAHADGNAVRAAYNRSTYADEHRALLDAWGLYLTRGPAAVVALRVA